MTWLFLVYLQGHIQASVLPYLFSQSSCLPPPQAPMIHPPPHLSLSVYSVLSIIMGFISTDIHLMASVNSNSQRQMEKILPHTEEQSLE